VKPKGLYRSVDADGQLGWSGLPLGRETLSLDFEGTGTLVYAKDYAPRLCQVSFEGRLAFVWDAEEHREVIARTVEEAALIIVHNGSYDLNVLDHCYGIPLELTWPKAVDTQEMARILYPTESEALKDLARRDLGAEVDSDKALREEFKRLRLHPIGTGYARIPLDNEVFVRYAGLDAIYTFLLWKIWKGRFE
jgi:3'-5' exonuclease